MALDKTVKAWHFYPHILNTVSAHEIEIPRELRHHAKLESLEYFQHTAYVSQTGAGSRQAWVKPISRTHWLTGR